MTKKIFTNRRAARFFVVQALYQMEHLDQPLQLLLDEFRSLHLHDKSHAFARDTNGALFEYIVQGVHQHGNDLDEKIQEVLSVEWPLERLDAVVRAVLRASAFELLFDVETPLPVIISEYLEVSKIFLAQGEVTFIHVVIDKLGSLLRSSD